MSTVNQTQSPVVAWAARQAHTGSVIDLGAGQGSLEALYLLHQGWRGLFIDRDPEKASDLAALFQSANDMLGRAAVLCVNVAGDARKLAGVDPYTIVGGVHPSEMFELWPELPQPRFLIVDIGPGSLGLLELVCDWVPIDAIRLTVPAGDAPAAAEWLSPWRGLTATEQAGTVSFTCERLIGLAPNPVGEPLVTGPHPPSSSVPL